jgi:hypothetical protein
MMVHIIDDTKQLAHDALVVLCHDLVPLQVSYLHAKLFDRDGDELVPVLFPRLCLTCSCPGKLSEPHCAFSACLPLCRSLACAFTACLTQLASACAQVSLEGDDWELTPCHDLAVTVAYTKAECLMHVMRAGEFVGFRSGHARDRLLRVSRRTRRLVLGSDKFGVYEQMRLVSVRLYLLQCCATCNCHGCPTQRT